MDATTARVIVIANTVGAPPEVYHRDFPEIRSQAHTIDEAIASLLHALARAMDSALTNWRREGLEQAVAEVRAFAAERAEQTPRAAAPPPRTTGP